MIEVTKENVIVCAVILGIVLLSLLALDGGKQVFSPVLDGEAVVVNKFERFGERTSDTGTLYLDGVIYNDYYIVVRGSFGTEEVEVDRRIYDFVEVGHRLEIKYLESVVAPSYRIIELKVQARFQGY